MKVIMVESIDNLGKDSQINKLYNEYKDKYNISIRHFEKPKPKQNESPLEFQFISFDNEIDYLNNISMMEKQFDYYNKENLIIYNRFYLGEYIYGTLYRKFSKEDIMNSIINPIENRMLKFLSMFDVLIINLWTDNFDIIIDDNKSLSKGSHDKMLIEQNLFKEIIDESVFKSEFVQVNTDNEFKSKDDIFNTIKKRTDKFLS